jgi:hypothetical protein
MYKLIAEEGYHWKKAGFIFSNVVWVSSPEDTKLYRLLDEDYEPIKDMDLSKHLIKKEWYFEKKEEEEPTET